MAEERSIIVQFRPLSSSNSTFLQFTLFRTSGFKSCDIVRNIKYRSLLIVIMLQWDCTPLFH